MSGAPSKYWRLGDLRKPKEKTAQPVEPLGEAKPVHFGPSSMVIAFGEHATTYTINLWVGGTGYGVDVNGKELNGGWGKNFTLTFDANNARKLDLEFEVKRMMTAYRDQIVNGYGESSADVIIHALGKVAAGHFYERTHTAEEIMGTA